MNLVTLAQQVSDGTNIQDAYDELALTHPDPHTIDIAIHILIEYTSPITHPDELVYRVGQQFLKKTTGKKVEGEEVKEGEKIDHYDSLSSTLSALSNECTFRGGLTYNESVYAFFRAKVGHDAPYFSYMAKALDFLAHTDCDAYTEWHRGVVEPYVYYHGNCVDSVPFAQYLSATDRFGILSAAPGAYAPQWVEKAIVPCVRYTGDTKRLVSWLLATPGPRLRYRLWRSVLELLPELLEVYVSRCFDEGLTERWSALESSAILEEMRKTLKERIETERIETTTTEKIDSTDLSPSSLLHIINVCQKLSPYMPMGIYEYEELKRGGSDLGPFLRSISARNYAQVFSAARIYVDEFVHENSHQLMQQLALRALAEGVYDVDAYEGVHDWKRLVLAYGWECMEKREIKGVVGLLRDIQEKEKKNEGELDDFSLSRLIHLSAVLDSIGQFHVSIPPSQVVSSSAEALVKRVLEASSDAYRNLSALQSMAKHAEIVHGVVRDECVYAAAAVDAALQHGDVEYAITAANSLLRHPEKAGHYAKAVSRVVSWPSSDRSVVLAQRKLAGRLLGTAVGASDALDGWRNATGRLEGGKRREGGVDKLGSLLVSGLGWAIGAEKH